MPGSEDDKIVVGIIGGSGLDDPEILKDAEELEINTPYGSPSSSFKKGRMGDVEVILLARHGRKHTIPPSEINNRANIYALRKLGCTHIVATTAVGSLKEEMAPGDLVFLDQFIDFTRHREVTFHARFKPHSPKHVSMAEPFSDILRFVLIDSAHDLGLKHNMRGTVITIEGPRFSTRAESNMFRGWGADLINMSTSPEAILANEAGIPYAAVAMVTDYDCWREGEEPVSWEKVLKVFESNAGSVKELLKAAVPKIKEENSRDAQGQN